MKTTLLLPLCAAALFCPAFSSAQEAKTYSIKYERPDKVGEKWREEAKAVIEKSQTLKQGDKVIKEEKRDLRVTLSGEVEVLEVSAKGDAMKSKFKVEKFTIQDEETPETQPVKPGTVITATGGEGRKDKFEADGKEITGDAAEALGELIQMKAADDKDLDEDAMLGTKTPRAAGTEWEVDRKAFLESLPDDAPFDLEEEDVTGKVKFPAVKTVNGIECCQVQMAVTLKPKELKGMPPGFKPSKINFKVSHERMVAVDLALKSPGEKMDQLMEFSGTIKGPAGSVEMSVYHRTTKERKRSELK